MVAFLGPLLGGALGYMGARSQARAIDRANAQNNQYLNAVMPFIKDNLGNVSGFYNNMIEAGPYQGDFYAGPNDMQTTANDAMYNLGMGNMTTGQNLMDATSGFGSNASDLYDKFTNLADRPDMMANATEYATNNMSPIVDAMMRDDRRTLTEQTLPGINMAASGSGNANASRAGVADALANRAYDDRLADVKTDVFNSLRDASLNQSNTEFGQGMTALTNAGVANNQMGNAFTTGSNLATAGGNMAFGAGSNQQGFDQGQLDADRNQFDYLTGYDYNLGKDYGSFLAGGSPGSGNYQTNYNTPMMGFGTGAMAGMGFQNQYFPNYNMGNSSFFNPMFGFQPGQFSVV